MKYLIPIIVAVALLAGCDNQNVDEIYLWEFQIRIPSETEPSAVIDLENKLRQAGFRKIVFRKHIEIGFVEKKCTGIDVFATRSGNLNKEEK
jgi:hypothetical protein